VVPVNPNVSLAFHACSMCKIPKVAIFAWEIVNLLVSFMTRSITFVLVAIQRAISALDLRMIIASIVPRGSSRLTLTHAIQNVHQKIHTLSIKPNACVSYPFY